MLDPETGRSPLVYALIQDMARAPNFGQGGGGGFGGIPLGSMMQLMQYLKQPGSGADPVAQPAPPQPLPTAGASAVV